MGKRYFCDYCDRSFQDNLHNRKKHLNGLQHLKAKKSWYDMFRDAAAILLDEQNKRPCRKFLLTGQCDFGPNCRFSHMSERDLQELSIQVEGLNPSEPPSSSTQWAGHRSRSCLRLCGHPHLGGGPCSPGSSGAESLVFT
ncbi:zinc finger matrin-type protein 5 isoform 2-T2 [Rhynchonycteris naso]